MNLNVFMPVKLVTGAGCVKASAKEIAKLGTRCLIVTGKTSAKASGALQDVTETLTLNGQSWCIFDAIGQNPKLTDCMTAAEQAIAWPEPEGQIITSPALRIDSVPLSL